MLGSVLPQKKDGRMQRSWKPSQPSSIEGDPPSCKARMKYKHYYMHACTNSERIVCMIVCNIKYV